ncbi:MAG: metal-dependent transcriptional regulator [Clostridia bacterium]|nr:metal-dependent transcriptional regulator [Clostridia bacterium]
MILQESGEMYLETIYILLKQKGNIRSIDVCEHLGYSKPSVSRAVGLLKNGGYINVDKNGLLTLTPEGLTVANKIYERHTIISDFLVKIGVEQTIADEDACKIEHVISNEAFNAIKNLKI